MFRSKKTFYLWILTAVLSVFIISGCSKNSEEKDDNNNSFTNSIVEENKSEAIMALFTDKYDRDSEEIIITIHKETDQHIRGSVKFNEEPDKTYLFLAARKNGDWQLVFEGEDAASCDTVEEFDFPEDMISDCYTPLTVVVEDDYEKIDISDITWRTYTNDIHGYSVQYPGICNVLAIDPDGRVQFDGPLQGEDHWPSIVITHYDSQYYRPAVGADINEWVKQFPGFIKGDAISVAGLPTVHFVQDKTSRAHAGDYYYFIKGDQLYNLSILHTGDRVDWDLYNQILNSFVFTEEEIDEEAEPPTEEIEVLDLEGQVSCVGDEDCVPLPGCHPHQCINVDFADQYEQPEICTLQFECSAAYNVDDCLCQSGTCVNINLTEGCIE
jgi:hypothetical protein